MPDTLSVGLNRKRLHAIELPATFSTDDSFSIELDNAGEATHVHIRLDDELSEVASIATTNHYVREGATERVPILIEDQRRARGSITIATGYGSESATTDVRIEVPKTEQNTVEIDDSLLDRPDGTNTVGDGGEVTTSADTGTRSPGTNRTTLLAAGVVVVALGVLVLLVPSQAVLLGVLAVVVGVAVLGYAFFY